MKDILAKKDATSTAKLSALLKEYGVANANQIDTLELGQLLTLLSAVEKLI